MDNQKIRVVTTPGEMSVRIGHNVIYRPERVRGTRYIVSPEPPRADGQAKKSA